MNLTNSEKFKLDKIPKYIRNKILNLTEQGDNLWIKGYKLDNKKEWGHGDHCKALGNGLYAQADKLYLNVIKENKSC